jgi:hypothetical protein
VVTTGPDTTGEPGTTTTGETETETGTTGSSSGCPWVDITAGVGYRAFSEAGLYSTISLAPALGDPDIVDRFRIEIFADDVGELDLGLGPNDDYATCEQCFLVYQDAGEEIGKVFFQASGTVTIDEDNPPLSGLASFTTRNVVLVEVTIDGATFESTPVPDGDCIELRNGTIEALVVENWTCETFIYGNADGCQCGCGVTDPDCPDTAGSSCVDCNPVGGCNIAGIGCSGLIDPDDNALCLHPLEVWTCADALYDGGDGQCDCGCALPDPDCDGGTVAECDTCNEPGSCGEDQDGCAGVIHQPNNAFCTQYPGWTCFDAYHGTDDGCDCGCGIPDPDCDDETVTACEFCAGPGSCSAASGLPCPGLIDPAANAQCLDPTEVWTCDLSLYDAGDGQCDCGCAVIDPDCDDVDVPACDTCNEPGSCGADELGCAGVIALRQNAYCTAYPGWTCIDGYYADGFFCDCGCGIFDPDCDDMLVGSCQFCNNEGSCAADLQNCATIHGTNNAICI